MAAAAQVLPVSPLVQAALQAHQQGRLIEAENLYQRALTADPADAVGWHLLAVLAHQRGDLETGIKNIRRAIELKPAVAQFQLTLGNLLKALGQLQEATYAYFLAASMDPSDFGTWNNLGTTYRALGTLREAEDALRAALRLQPGNPDALCNLAAVCLDTGKNTDAIELLRKVTTLQPTMAEAWFNLGNALAGQGADEQAEAAYRRAVEVNPGLSSAWYNLGNTLCRLERLEDAGTAYQQVLKHQPNHVPSIFNLGNVLQAGQLFEEAIECYREVLRHRPEHALAHFWWATALGSLGRSTEASEHYDLALSLDPGMAKAYHMKGGMLYNQGRITEAVSVSRKALAVQSDMPFTFSNSLFMMNYADGTTAEELVSEHREYDLRFAAKVVRRCTYSNGAEPDRPLRVGYLSADLRRHSVSYFIEPVLENHDPRQVEPYCYFNWSLPDEVTARLKNQVRGWTDCYWMSDDELAARIAADGIDVLVDLNGHTAGNRMLTLARKPAPVQITYLGYPTTTGMAAVDYRLTDWQADPEGYEAFSVEQLLRLPHSYYCYRPMPSTPEVAPLPMLETGHVTFGSFNNFAKVSERALALWARLLAMVPGSRLMLKAKSLQDVAVQESVRARMAKLGVHPDRLILRGWEKAVGGQLELLRHVDIALDTFPYNGGTTTCEALWMGVPVLTLCGATHASRMGASLLGAAGLPEMVTTTEDEFLRRAGELAGDPARLAALRSGMRERLKASPLMDEAGFTRAIESLYREAWRRWCAARPAA